MYNQPIEHEYLGRFVDYDCRTKDFGKPYDSKFVTVLQNAKVEKVSRNTDGNLMVHFRKDGPPYLMSGVVKLYE